MPGTLILFADDTPADVLRFMPHTRRLARRGTTFTRAYANSPVCMPSRCSVNVGRYAERTGIFTNTESDATKAIEAGRWTHQGWGSWVADVGVRSMFIGKYHMETGAQPGPPDAGWTVQRSMYPPFDSRRWKVRDENGVVTEEEGWHTDYATAEILEFIGSAEAAGAPWFVWWCAGSPHWPFVTTPGKQLQFTTETLPIPPQHGSGWPSWVVERPLVVDQGVVDAIVRGQAREMWDLDQQVGRMVAHLSGAGDLDESTIVVTGDNGLHRGDHRLVGGGLKNEIYEAAARVPFVVAGPGFPPGRRVDVPVALVDMTATVLDQFGATADWPLDGEDLRRIASNPVLFEDRAILVQVRPQESGETRPPVDAVVRGHVKLARYFADDPDRFELYDLDADPGELRNLAYEPEHAPLRADMEACLDDLLAS